MDDAGMSRCREGGIQSCAVEVAEPLTIGGRRTMRLVVAIERLRMQAERVGIDPGTEDYRCRRAQRDNRLLERIGFAQNCRRIVGAVDGDVDMLCRAAAV